MRAGDKARRRHGDAATAPWRPRLGKPKLHGGLCLLLLATAAFGAGGFPQADESLQYTVNWPSGLSLGEGRLDARKSAAGWEFELQLDAAVPGYAVADRYRSLANGELCSQEFEKNSVHGRRTAREKTVFDYRRNLARRNTVNGGKSELPIPACAHDALAFVFHVRRELAQGRVPPPQAVLFGSPYQVRLDFGGPQMVAANERREQADRVAVSFKGPASAMNFEVFFARDAARTPLVIRVPFALGTFSMELVR